MRKLILSIAVVACTCLMAQAEMSVIEGYGKAKWGQSVEDVKAQVPDLELSNERGSIAVYVSSAGVPQQTKYFFGNDQFSAVTAFFKLPDAPASGIDKAGAEILSEMVKKKYGSEEVVAALKEAGITIRVKPYDDGRVEVSYTNQTAFSKASAAAEKARQKALAAPKKSPEARRKAFAKAGIEDAL